ncbi:MAG: DUF1080 domain-containing protein [Cyclobacteriaceae bacterium]|nr:DUF1080 domain-containing protein [Cyclobacteriaceae bacterium]
MKTKFLFLTLIFLGCNYLLLAQNRNDVPDGFLSLFNGNDFTNWKVPEGDNGHWKLVDGVIDYDAESEAEGDKNLWSEKEYEDFVLYVDWRIKETPFMNQGVPIILPSGLHKLDENGKVIKIVVPDSDSGIYLRGSSKSQVNIWCWPVGSGEVYGYRMDNKMSAEVRSGVTPNHIADNNIGEWNTFRIEVVGSQLTVDLNGFRIIDSVELPGLPEKGAIALQHHGSKRDGEWRGPPSLVQFRNISISEL